MAVDGKGHPVLSLACSCLFPSHVAPLNMGLCEAGADPSGRILAEVLCFGGSVCSFVFCFFSIAQGEIQPAAQPYDCCARHKRRVSCEQGWVAGGKGGAGAFPSSAAPAEIVCGIGNLW